MAGDEGARLYLIAPPVLDFELPGRLAPLLDGFDVACVRLALAAGAAYLVSSRRTEHGPPGSFIVGHLAMLNASQAWRTYARWAKTYGPVLRLRAMWTQMAVLGDRRQLVSALYNLLENAVKFSYDGGSVRIAGRRSETDVVLEIEDHGVGIPARDLERIFERFYRVDQGRSRMTGGTGLGRSIVRHVAANHQGRVEVDSREGEGSTFRLIVPAQSELTS